MTEHSTQSLLILATHLKGALAIHLIDDISPVFLVLWHTKILQHCSHLIDGNGIGIVMETYDLEHNSSDMLLGN
jgi:hypothetical protein